jgi:5-methylcytosine-specific restriction enzyme A
MIKENIKKIMEQYPAARNQLFRGHLLASFIRKDFPELVKRYFPQYDDLLWVASPGIGQWAYAPWLAILDPLVTDTPQKGYYPVFLFSSDLKSVYLSLNQGITAIVREFSPIDTTSILINRSMILRKRINNEYPKLFSDNPINLKPIGKYSYLFYYERGHAFGKKYSINELPEDDVFKADISYMLELYKLVIFRGGTSEFDNDQTSLPDQNQDISLSEERKYRYHLSLDRNKRLVSEVKRIHGYSCEVCGMNFEKAYGPIGEEYIEAHHKLPLHLLKENGPVSLSAKNDFAVVCSNCHSMLHRDDSKITFDEFRNKFLKRKIYK